MHPEIKCMSLSLVMILTYFMINIQWSPVMWFVERLRAVSVEEMREGPGVSGDGENDGMCVHVCAHIVVCTVTKTHTNL